MKQVEEKEPTLEEKFRELNREDFRELSQAPRRRSREASLMLLFAIEMGSGDWQMAQELLAALELSDENAAFVQTLVEGVQRQKGVLDDLLEKYARDWDVNRFAAVDKSILRLALFELLHPIDTPASIIINEAIELAKK
ncbi:MAG: transcription antitermination factor NusB, partial [Clostridiales bacterium]